MNPDALKKESTLKTTRDGEVFSEEYAFRAVKAWQKDRTTTKFICNQCGSILQVSCNQDPRFAAKDITKFRCANCWEEIEKIPDKVLYWYKMHRLPPDER